MTGFVCGFELVRFICERRCERSVDQKSGSRSKGQRWIYRSEGPRLGKKKSDMEHMDKDYTIEKPNGDDSASVEK